jgi:hypothetical protein
MCHILSDSVLAAKVCEARNSVRVATLSELCRLQAAFRQPSGSLQACWPDGNGVRRFESCILTRWSRVAGLLALGK